MPTSFLELLLFAATLSPGFAFLKSAERRRPAKTQSALRETAEMFVVGSTATLAALLVVAGAVALFGLGSTSKLIFGPPSYAAEHLVGIACAGLLVYGLACLVAFKAASVIYGDKLELTENSAWFQAFRERLPEGGENSVVVTTKSNQTYTGAVLDYTSDNSPVGERELVIAVGESDLSKFAGAHDDEGVVQIIVPGDEIASIELVYVELQTSENGQH